MASSLDETEASSQLTVITTVACRSVRLLKISDTLDSSCSCCVSVHQLSLQLWRLFRTPRVSVQKKIEHLGIPLLQCTKEQVCFLRKHKAVEGFRATMVRLADAENLYDAVQFSRERREFNKHKRKAKIKEPNNLAQVKIPEKKKTAGQVQDRDAKDTATVLIVDGCASFRTPPQSRAAANHDGLSSPSPPLIESSLILDTLLIVDRPVYLRSLYKHKILKILNEACSTQAYSGSNSSLEMLRSRQAPGRDVALVQHPPQNDRPSDISKSDNETPSTRSKRCALNRETAVLFISGEGNDSSATTRSSDGLKGLGAVPVTNMSIRGDGVLTTKPPRPYLKRVHKLRHFAQTSSPNAAMASPGKHLPLGSIHPKQKPSVPPLVHLEPLLVKISRSMINIPSDLQKYPPPPPSPSYLMPGPSHFKPSSSHESPPSSSSSGTNTTNKMRPKKVTLSSLAIKKRARSPSNISVPPALIKVDSISTVISMATTMSTSSKGSAHHQHTAGIAADTEKPDRYSKENSSFVPLSTSCSSGSTFKFNELFSYYPPKLVVQDGDLCPQHTLSVNGLDRSRLNDLPQSHPFWNWTLGQPTTKIPAPVIKSCRKTRSKN